MSTSVKVINFGPRAVKVSVVQTLTPADPLAAPQEVKREVETLYLYAVSRELVLHGQASVRVEEVPETPVLPAVQA